MRRNLSAGEIVGQVLALQTDRGTLPKRLNVVIMGMGEPLHNYDNVMRAITLMVDNGGHGPVAAPHHPVDLRSRPRAAAPGDRTGNPESRRFR